MRESSSLLIVFYRTFIVYIFFIFFRVLLPPPMLESQVKARGLIFEAYNMVTVSEAECRSIFLDWALGVPIEKDTQEVITKLLLVYEMAAPDHPMTETLREGLKTLASPRRRGGWRGRPRSSNELN